VEREVDVERDRGKGGVGEEGRSKRMHGG